MLSRIIFIKYLLLPYHFYMILLFGLSASVCSQTTDISCVANTGEGVFYYLFRNDNNSFCKIDNAFSSLLSELKGNHPELTVSGDFNKDGQDEIAMFYDLTYLPGMNPGFNCSVIMVFKSQGNKWLPIGNWFSIIDTAFNLAFADFAVAGDYNMDGYSDIAVIFNNLDSEIQSIYVFESTGSSFSGPKEYYTTIREYFNFSTLKFAMSGDFNHNGNPDIAVFYNYFGRLPTTPQAVFIFESNGGSFSLLPAFFSTTKEVFDFSLLQFAVPGDYNNDNITDIAVFYDDSLTSAQTVFVFEGSASGFSAPEKYFESLKEDLNFSDIKFALPGYFNDDTLSDIAVFYDNPVTEEWNILIFETYNTSFLPPKTGFTYAASDYTINNITVAVSGNFFYNPSVSATTWKNNKKGAISFTFDDGALGAFAHGASCLDNTGLKGTYYIFTDTNITYDFKLAGFELINKYRNKNFEIGSHTSNHSNLGILTALGNYDSLNNVLSNSFNILNERFNQNTFSMSIPYGSFRYETLDYIKKYFYSARSSLYGYNLATPFDFFALKSYPVLSSTSTAVICDLADNVVKYGYYLPLMYHDISDVPFDYNTLIYTYSLDNFKENVDSMVKKNVWIDTHQNVYKYIRERNAFKVSDIISDGNSISFIPEDGLDDMIFNMEVTLNIKIPDLWECDTVTIEHNDIFDIIPVSETAEYKFVYYNILPDNNRLTIYKGLNTGIKIIKHDEICDIRFSATPNPFNDKTILRTEGIFNPEMYIDIFDIRGTKRQTIRPDENNEFEVKRDHLNPGIYFVRLYDQGSVKATLKLLAL